MNQFAPLNGLNAGEFEFQESPLAPSQPPIENGDSCRLFFEPTAPSHMEFSQTPYYHAQLPNYGNAVTGAHPTQTMAPGGQPSLAIQQRVGSHIVNGPLAVQSGVNGSIPGQSGVHGRLAMQPGVNGAIAVQSGLNGRLPMLSGVNGPLPVQSGRWYPPGLGGGDPSASSRSPPSHQAARPIANTGVKAAKSPGGSKAAGVVSTSPIRELHFKYRVFAHSVIYEIEKANSAKVASNDLSKATKKIISTNDVKWTASLEDYTWEEFVPAAFNMLGRHRLYLDKHLYCLFDENELKFQFILFRHTKYGGVSEFFVKNNETYDEFAAAVRASPDKKVTISISMVDPSKVIKDNDLTKDGDAELELLYAPEKQKVAKAKMHARLAMNPKADMDAVRDGSRVEELAANIIAKYGCNAETMRIKDPKDPHKSIAIHSQGLRSWSCAWVAGAPGVDIDTPPSTREFVSEDKRVYTLAEEAVRQGGRRAPKTPDPFDLLSIKTPSNQGPRFGPARVSTSGRIMAPRLLPNAPSKTHSAPPKCPVRSTTTTPRKSASSLSTTASPASAFWLSPEPPETRPTSPNDFPEDAVDELSTTAAGDSDTGEEESAIVMRRLSPKIEVLLSRADHMGVHRLPARKAMRSPCDSSISDSVSRLNFGGSRAIGRLTSRSPTRKRPGSTAPSLGATTRSKSPRPATHLRPIMDSPASEKFPLNDLGLAMTLDEFVDHCNLGPHAASVARGFIQLNHISHWDFFYRDATKKNLQQLLFPYAIACDLLKGAQGLEATHVKTAALE
ncbi:hypothetical protein MJO29_015467 [Puccinia striiformis f. sp. tritici]|nr:hypothetical protein MJO29_015467 [Puccinia striiformis f. sp. tritici]